MADKLPNNGELRGKILILRVKNLLRQGNNSEAKKLLVNANENKNYPPNVRNEIFYECGNVFWQNADVKELDQYFSGVNFDSFVPAYQRYIFDSISRLYEKKHSFTAALIYARRAAEVKMEEQNAIFSPVPLWVRAGELELKNGNRKVAEDIFEKVIKDGERQLAITTADDEAGVAGIFVAMAKAMQLKSDYDVKKYKDFLSRALADPRTQKNDIGYIELQKMLNE